MFSSLAGAQFSPPAIPVRFMSRVKPQENSFFLFPKSFPGLGKTQQNKHNNFVWPFSYLKSLV